MTLQDEVEKVIAENIVVDASGLSPAVVSAFVHGHKEAAQAAIAAVLRAQMEPSEGMVDAGSRDFSGDLVSSRGAADIHRAMLTAFASEHDVEIG